MFHDENALCGFTKIALSDVIVEPLSCDVMIPPGDVPAEDPDDGGVLRAVPASSPGLSPLVGSHPSDSWCGSRTGTLIMWSLTHTCPVTFFV